jgi:hypothetical protein
LALSGQCVDACPQEAVGLDAMLLVRITKQRAKVRRFPPSQNPDIFRQIRVFLATMLGANDLQNWYVGLDMPHDAADLTDREALQLGSTTGRTHMIGGGQLLRPQRPAGTVPAHPCPRPNGWDRSPVG